MCCGTLDPRDPGNEPTGSLLNTVILKWILTNILVYCGLDPPVPGYDSVGSFEYGNIKMDLKKIYNGTLWAGPTWSRL